MWSYYFLLEENQEEIGQSESQGGTPGASRPGSQCLVGSPMLGYESAKDA